MRRIALVVALVAAFSLGGVLVHAATSGTPEVDNANATQSLQGRLVAKQCTGEDGIAYVTFRGTFAGSETETTPGLTDYDLSGSLTVKGIVWTINGKTGRGVLTGTIALVSTAGIPEYTGKITMITQGFPTVGGVVPGRGWIVAGFAPADEAPAPPGDDSLLANVEWNIGATTISGAFGDAAPLVGFPNFSVVTNVAPKALDGVC
jgi:hypothetical protein